MTLGLYLLIGLFAAAPDTTMPGVPVEAALRIIHPMVNQGTLGRNAILLALVNRSRAEAGLKSLQWDNRLADAANEHAQLMSAKGELSHQFPGEPDLANRLIPKLRLDQAGENVFYDASLESAHEAFMKSPNHRANLLNPAYDSIGIGIVEFAGLLFIVEDFAHRVPELSNEDAAGQVAQQFAKLRQAAGTGELRFQHDAHLQSLACSMAERDTRGQQSGNVAARRPRSGLLCHHRPVSTALQCRPPERPERPRTDRHWRLLRPHPEISHRPLLGQLHALPGFHYHSG